MEGTGDRRDKIELIGRREGIKVRSGGRETLEVTGSVSESKVILHECIKTLCMPYSR
jgi:hypothetical protein